MDIRMHSNMDKLRDYFHLLRHKKDLRKAMEYITERKIKCVSCGFVFDSVDKLLDRTPIIQMDFSSHPEIHIILICNKDECRIKQLNKIRNLKY